MLSIIGKERSYIMGEKTGSVLWADVCEHPMPDVIAVYGLDKVFQVFGHTRLDGTVDDVFGFDHFAMIDSQKCFLIDESQDKRIMAMPPLT